jgi:hypothetical protein
MAVISTPVIAASPAILQNKAAAISTQERSTIYIPISIVENDVAFDTFSICSSLFD